MFFEDFYIYGATESSNLSRLLADDKEDLIKAINDSFTIKNFARRIIKKRSFWENVPNTEYSVSTIFEFSKTEVAHRRRRKAEPKTEKSFEFDLLKEDIKTQLIKNSVKTRERNAKIKEENNKIREEGYRTNQWRDFIAPTEASWYTVYQTKFFSFSVRYIPSPSTSIFELKIEANLSPKTLKFLFDLVGDDVAIKYIPIIVRFFWTDGVIPAVFDPEYKPVSNFSGIIKLKNGNFFYVPPGVLDKREEFFDLTRKNNKVPVNMPICLDLGNEVFFYTSGEGNIRIESLNGNMPITDEDIYFFLKGGSTVIAGHTIEHCIFSVESPIAAFRFIQTKITLDTKWQNYRQDHASDRIIELKDEAQFKPFIAHIQSKVVEGKDRTNPVNYLKCLGVIQLIVKFIDRYPIIKSKIEKQKASFNEKTEKDLPAVPSWTKDIDFRFLPHQGESLAKLEAAEELAILAIGTGGGKALIVIADILILMKAGKVKRPLVVMPTSILGQYIGEIAKFTQRQVNAICITPQTRSDWGEKLTKTVKDAPPNTIFLSSYSFLITGIDKTSSLGHKYGGADWIKEHVKPDYICLDESQNAKNPDTLRAKAVSQLRFAKYRRIATGTLIVNKYNDLVGQLAFLNPRILGDKDEFDHRYMYDKGTKEKPNIGRLIRNDLKERAFFLDYHERDWAACLPRVKYSYHFVEFTQEQERTYKKILDGIMDEIMGDDKLRREWEAYLLEVEENDDLEEDLRVPPQILAKFTILEQFICSPIRDPFIKEKGSPKDKTSAKVKKIDELIDESLAVGQKCIVGIHFKESARHFYENSKHKDKALYYDANRKGTLQLFLTNDNIRVLFAVSQSLSEGLNLQIANRIIIADIDWTSGKTKQFIARVWRTTGKKEDTLKTVYIDYVLANNSADIPKLGLMLRKKIKTAQVIEGYPGAVPDRMDFTNPNIFVAPKEVLYENRSIPEDINYTEFTNKQIEEKRNDPNYLPVKAKHAPNLQGNLIKTPWVMGMTLPDVPNGIPLLEYLRDRNLNIDTEEGFDLTRAKDFLLENDTYVYTEWGMGIVVGVNATSVRVKYSNGKESTSNGYVVIYLKKKLPPGWSHDLDEEALKKIQQEQARAPKKLKPPKPKEEEPEEDREVIIRLGMFNSRYILLAYSDDPDTALLKQSKFIKHDPYWYFVASTRARANEFIHNISNDYTITTEPLLRHAVSLMTKMKTASGEIFHIIDSVQHETIVDTTFKDFLFHEHTLMLERSKKVVVFPLLVDNALYFVLDAISHPWFNGVSYKMRKKKGFWFRDCGLRPAVAIARIKQAIKDIETKLVITNKASLLHSIHDDKTGYGLEE